MKIKKIKEDVERFIKKYEKKKKPDNLQKRAKQKDRLKRASQLLGYDVPETRKLSITYNKDERLNEITTPNTEQEELRQEELIQEITPSIKKNENKTTNQEIPQTDITIKDITNYFKLKGVVGEESLCTKIFLAGSNNISFGVEGYSGSGKTFVVDKLIELYAEEDLYRLDLSSKMAVFYDSKNINNYKTIYIPELQKALKETKSPIVEVVKNLTEGKDVKRIVTDYKKRGNKTFNIKRGKSIIYTLASENTYKNDEELNRRFLRFKTNHEENHLEKILKQKSLRRQTLIKESDEELHEKLKQHFNYLRNKKINTYDPYSEAIIEYLPKTQKAIGYTEHYYALLDATTKLNHKRREKIETQEQEYIITNIEDHFLVHKLYHQEFLKTLKDFSKRNNNREEVDEIQHLENKKIDWGKIINKGTIIKRNELGLNENYTEEYIQELEQKYAYLTN